MFHLKFPHSHRRRQVSRFRFAFWKCCVYRWYHEQWPTAHLFWHVMTATPAERAAADGPRVVEVKTESPSLPQPVHSTLQSTVASNQSTPNSVAKAAMPVQSTESAAHVQQGLQKPSSPQTTGLNREAFLPPPMVEAINYEASLCMCTCMMFLSMQMTCRHRGARPSQKASQSGARALAIRTKVNWALFAAADMSLMADRCGTECFVFELLHMQRPSLAYGPLVLSGAFESLARARSDTPISG